MASSTPTATPSPSYPNLPGLGEPGSRADDRSPGPVTEEEIEQVADQLLADSIDALGRGDYPFYSECWIRQLETRDRLHPVLDREDDLGVHDPQAMVYRLLRHTGMSVHQRRIIHYTCAGMKPHLIGPILHKSDSYVRSQLSTAICELARVAAGDGYLTKRDQIRQVRLQDENRHPPDKRCPDRCLQPCNRSGKCPFRWYLYV